MRRERGITLVSLIVTIIVLIILAGVSINLTLGENGLITMAKKARENMELATIEEETKLNALYTQIELEDENIGGIDNNSISKLIEFKQKVASAITDMGIETLETANADTMANNIRSISTNKDASSINYDNTTSELNSSNVQEAIDELDGEVDELNERLDNYEFIGEIKSLNGSITIDRTKYKRIYMQLMHGEIGIINSHEIPNIIAGKYSEGRFIGNYYLSEYWNVTLGLLLNDNTITMDKLQVVGYGDYTICRVYAK